MVTERNRDEFDEVSNKRLTSMAADVASGLAYLSFCFEKVACESS